MNILRVLIVLFLMTLNAHAAVVPIRVTGGTVDFTTDTKTVTFNSITKHIILQNNSTIDDCFVNILCKDDDSYAGSLIYYTVRVPATGSVSPNTIEIDFATNKISTWSNAGSGGTLTYIMTGEVDTL